MSTIRNEFDSILRKWGHNIFLQRVLDPFDGEKLKYSNIFERHTVRHVNATGYTNQKKEEMEGIRFDQAMVYYMRYESSPSLGDRIYENIEKYPNNTITYIIDTVTPMRGESGKISFWTVGATREGSV